MPESSKNFGETLKNALSDFLGGYATNNPNFYQERIKLQKALEDAEEDRKLKKAQVDLYNAQWQKIMKDLMKGEETVDIEVPGYEQEVPASTTHPSGITETPLTEENVPKMRREAVAAQKKTIPQWIFKELPAEVKTRGLFGPAFEKGKEEEIKSYSPGSWLFKGGKALGQLPEKPEKEEKAPSELIQFEMETGTSSDLRGTKDYQTKINAWRREKKEVLQITSPFEQGKFAATLRKEFEDLRPVKDFRDTFAKFSVMKEAYLESKKTKNYVATDQALITLFNKMTDPQSVVRESEYARTPSDLALWNRLKGKIDRLKQGGPGLTDEDRKALLTMSGKFMKVYEGIYRDEIRRYRGYANMSGIEPDAVAPNLKEIKYEAGEKTIIRTGIDKKTSRKVIQYDDGSIEYAEQN